MKRGLLALSPIVAMVALLIGFSIYYGGVSNAPLLFIFALTAIIAVLTTRGVDLKERVAIFSTGAGSRNLLLMVWIFMFAGAFAASAKQMGAADAMVDLTLRLLPAHFALVGLFFAACITSLCMGTSVGTIVALIPIAAGIAERTEMAMPMVAAAVVGGAFFGDNLSFISDTTIVATQTQGCKLSDKFRFNVRMVLPVAVIAGIIYVVLGNGATEIALAEEVMWWKVIPYLTVLICAACGMNVLTVLVIGNLLTCCTGIIDGSYDMMGWINSTLQGIMGMSELILISMLAGGIFALISHNGGLDFVVNSISRRVKTRSGAEFSICTLVAFANICTANNTIAILSVGDIARRVSEQFEIDPRRSASLLDTTSCCVQGLLPYGAQLLMASGLAGISAMSIVPYLFYPFLLGIAVLATIAIRSRKKQGSHA
ncbi:MAG: Na+/H+ antiporter NhaC family protein [Paludibacteraceae bacterium]|nr:Na+/H+ antiporter NhaC family protein [Paludibacteraceae bacterium]